MTKVTTEIQSFKAKL